MMDRFDEATNFGLVLTAVEMGQAVTEAGAVSAVAAFFRQKLDACAWTENASSAAATAATTATAVPPVTASATGAPPLLRLPLGASAATTAATADYCGGAPAARPRPPLDLVVSRGPGPAFSASETRTAAQAAALLRQALARVRDRGSLAEAEAALESSLRGMQEASEAVAVLVAERERRAQRQEQQRSDAAEEHGRALSAAGDELARSRAEAEGFRRRLAEAEEAVAVVADAANALCRAASGSDGSVLGGGEGVGMRVRVREGVGARVGEGVGVEEKVGTRAGTGVGELVAEAERAARKALRCFFARVERGSKDGAAEPAADPSGEGDASPGTRETLGESLREPLRAGERNVNENRSRKLKLRVSVPLRCDPATPLVLSLRRRSRENDFTEGDERLASTLAACLSTAISALREKQRSLHNARAVKADRKARAGHEEMAAAAAAAASAEARERRERAIAGTRALAAAAQASEARPESGAEAAARAERQTEALRHLLSGLRSAEGDHAAVAEAVAERVAAAIPTCVSAVLLTPRQGNRYEGRYERALPPPPLRVDPACDSCFVFSPDPRVWAARASEEHRRRGSSGREGRRRMKSGRWTDAIGRAASQAASSGKTVCVMDRGVDASLGAEAGASSSVFIACFSPVCATAPACTSEIESKTNAYGAKENLRPAVPGGAVGTNAIPGARVGPRCADRSVCVIAWMLSLPAGVLDADGIGQSNTRSLPTTATTRSFAAATTTAAEGMMMTTPATLPPWVSAAMEGVTHAVGLAVSSAAGDSFDPSGKSRSANFGTATVWDGLAAGSSTTGGFRTINARHGSREGGHELLLGGRSEDNFSRDEDLSRLREGTSALSGRVQTLERRAAGLRASEARSAAALARARVDAMAVKGQLQLAGLERDRLLSRLKETEGRAVQREAGGVARRPLASARSTGNRGEATPPAVSSLGWREGGGRTASAFVSARNPYKEPTGIVKVVTKSARPEGGSWAEREAAVPGGVGTPGAAATATSAEGRVAVAADCGGSEATRRFDSQESVGADDDTSSSSQALQRMASLHARLSDSLRRGGVS